MATIGDKLDRIISGIQGSTGVTSVTPGSKMYQMSQSTAKEQQILEAKIDDYATANSILNAKGQDLTEIGRTVFGVDRLGEIRPVVTASMKAMKFYVAVGTFGDINKDSSGLPADIVIPEGTVVEGVLNGIQIAFRVTTEVTLPSSSQEVYFSADQIRGDNSVIPARTIKTHQFKNYTQSVNNLLLVINDQAIATGRDEQGDDDYRFRLSTAFKVFPKTNEYAIYDTAISTPGVSSAVVDKSPSGGGTFTVYVQGVTPITADETIEDVKSALADQIPPWVSYDVVKFNSVGLQVTFDIAVNGAPDVARQTITSAISNHINNYYGSLYSIVDLKQAVIQSSQDIVNSTLTSVRVYSGSTYRSYYEVDPINNPSAVIGVGRFDKLVVEPIPTAIILNITEQ